MNLEGIVLELLERIQKLEKAKEELETRISGLENQRTANRVSDEEISESEEENAPRRKMTAQMIEACYQCAVELANGRLQNEDLAVQKTAAQNEINPSSAKMYVYVVECMLRGETYKRTISSTATRQYLRNIERDYGAAGLQRALQALDGHIRYRHQCGQIVISLEKILKQYREEEGRK